MRIPPSAPPAVSALPLAALLYPPDFPIATLMQEIAQDLRRQGVQLGGMIETGDCHDGPMLLEDLRDGRQIRLSLPAVPDNTCRLDPSALADAAVAIRQAIDDGVELLLFNKFGAREAAGSGLRDEIGQALLREVPVLIAVSERLQAEWQAYTAGQGVLLPPEHDAALRWWAGLRSAR